MNPSARSSAPAPPPDAAQRLRIVRELDVNMMVEAAAGTGKTTSLLSRLVALIAEGKSQVHTLAAVTFTRKAAAELRGRFQVALEEAADSAQGAAADRLRDALENVDRCFIGTIHSFCARLLRERPVEAGVDLAFRELDEHVDARLREQAWNEYVAELFARDDAILRELDDLGITGLITRREQVLAELNELGLDVTQIAGMFRRFAEFPDVPDWPAEPVVLPDLGPAIDAVRVYLRHMESLGPSFPEDRGHDRLMDLYERLPRLWRHVHPERTADVMNFLAQFRTVKVVQRDWPGGAAVGKREKNRWEAFVPLVEPLVTRWLEKRYEAILRAVKPAVAVYDRLRRQSGGLNFQDLLLKAAELLRGNPGIRTYFRKRVTHLLIDEFQDTDPIQAEVMLLLTADDPRQRNWRLCRPAPGALFVVGDPKQSIYRFRRADIVTYNEVKRIIEDAGGQIVPLTANFRSTSQLVEWTNAIFEEAFPAQADRFSPQRRKMLVGRTPGTSGQLSGVRLLPRPEKDQPQALAAESEAVARCIRQALDSRMTVARTPQELARGATPTVTPGDFLIVTYKRVHLSLFARKLQELGIPHQVTGGSALGGVPEVALLAQCLSAILEPDNPVALVAVLRGPLLGFSDPQLYDFRSAGGRFDFRAPVKRLADSLDSETYDRFRLAFARLQTYAVWLRRLPALSAIERIAGNLGLFARALASAGGPVQAGSLAKVLERLRDAQLEAFSLGQLLQLLQQWLDDDAEFDGLSARAEHTDVVRLMNLHKVKGLEAPIVFLSAAAGKPAHPITLHIDRSSDPPRGYAAIYGPRRAWSAGALLAQPVGWTHHVQEERRFQTAEWTRLMYVAATRAGSMLTIVQRTASNNKNPWEFFARHLQGCPTLTIPAAQQAPPQHPQPLQFADVSEAEDHIREAWTRINEPSYLTAAAKSLALPGARPRLRPADGEHGSEWGELIHVLLQTRMRDPRADLHTLAAAVVVDLGLDEDLIEPALSTAQRVAESDIWSRARRAIMCLAETPFQMLQPSDASSQPPTVIRGVVDLAFQEADGWVIVDYKTDAVADQELNALIEYYRPQVQLYARAWEQISGQPVKEQGLYFTRPDCYVAVETRE